MRHLRTGNKARMLAMSSRLAGRPNSCRRGNEARSGDAIFETYWTKRRGAEAVDYSYALMDLTVFGRQEAWEDSPPGWPRRGIAMRTLAGAPEWPPLWEWPGGRPTAQWPRLADGYSDDLGATGAGAVPPPDH